MIQLLFPSTLWLGVFLFFTNVYAANSCYELFHNREKPPLVVELERNQRLDWLEHSADSDGTERLWTLSYSDDFRYFSMYQFVDPQGYVTHVSIRPVTYEIERTFYTKAGRYFEPEVEFFKIPGIGKRFIHVSEYTRVKLLVKHGITVEFLFNVLEHLPGYQEKRFVTTSIKKNYHVDGIVYFYSVIHEGQKRRLTVVFEQNSEDPEMLDVLTAYFFDQPSGY